MLGASQIRYCLAEDIRLTAAKQVVSEYNSNDVDRFNAMVADYNSRCSNFRYRRGALESARSEVEKFRADLLAQGSGRFASVSRIGRTSITVKVEVYAERFHSQGQYVKVTEASVTYVAIDDDGKPREIPKP